MRGATTVQIPDHDSVGMKPHMPFSPRVCGGRARPRVGWIRRTLGLFGRVRKDSVFFSLLNQLAQCTATSAIQLQQLAREYPNADASEQLRRLRVESRRLVNHTLEQLDKSFLAPFDPQDIHTLARELNYIVDTVTTLAGNIPLFQIKVIERGFAQQADVLVASTSAVCAVVSNLRGRLALSELRDRLIEIHHHESVGDDNHHAALSRLLDGTHDALDVLRWKELYEYVEEAIDGCEDVGNTLTRLVLKGG
jgi:uncharacterized protein